MTRSNGRWLAAALFIAVRAAAALSATAALHAPAAEEFLKDGAVGRVVVDDQHVQAVKARRRIARSAPGCLTPEAGDESELAPLPRLARQPDPAAHHLDQMRRDRQPQSGAAVAAGRRRVGLHERPEDLPLLVLRDADAGVGDGEAQRRLHRRSCARLATFDDDFARVGELDGVADQVDEHLPEPPDVADQVVGHIGRGCGRRARRASRARAGRAA